MQPLVAVFVIVIEGACHDVFILFISWCGQPVAEIEGRKRNSSRLVMHQHKVGELKKEFVQI